jgi:uncharacterized membrane protein (DUF106 family)
MSVLNAVLRAAVNGLLAPFRGLSPWVGLTVVSILTAVPMLLVFRATSNQEALAAVKKRIHAGLFEIRLFNDDLRAILRAQLAILRQNLSYLRLSLPPMIWIVPPLVLLFAQLQFHYGYRGLAVDQPVLLEASLAEAALDGAPDKPELRLEVPEGLRVETPPLWIPSEKRFSWRIAAERRGDFTLKLSYAGQEVEKSVRAGDRVVLRSPERLAPGFLNQLLYPAEPSLPGDGPFTSITVGYPELALSLFGLEMPWWVAYLGLLFLVILALRNAFGVTI